MNINLDSAKDTLCKNILIYGYCKFENKGCAFNHNKSAPNQDSHPSQLQQQPGQVQGQNSHNPIGQGYNPPHNQMHGQLPTQQLGNNATQTPIHGGHPSGQIPPGSGPGTTETKRKFNLNTPSFQPGVQNVTAKFANLSPKLKDIPVFVPLGPNYLNRGTQSQPLTPGQHKIVAPAPGLSQHQFQHLHQSHLSASNGSAEDSDPLPVKKFNVSTPSFTPSNIFSQEYSSTPPPLQQQPGLLQSLNQSNTQPNPYLNPPSSSEVYYQQATYPLQYHLYAPQPPPRLSIPLPPYETNTNRMFIDNELRESLHRKNEATLQLIPRSSLPEHVHVYHSLVPIDKSYESMSKVWNIPTDIYKVYSNIDGNPYCLNRIDNSFEISNDIPFRHVKRWKSVKCPNVVQLQDVFTSMAFGEKSQLVVVYDYYPNASTLLEHHKRSIGRVEPITEELLWTYLVQLIMAIQAIHEKGLAARTSLDLLKIIVTSKNRIRLSGVGINDIIDYEHDEEQIETMGMAKYRKSLQRMDITLLGRCMVELTSLTIPHTLRNMADVDATIKSIKTSSQIPLSDEYIRVLEMLNQTSDEFDVGRFIQSYLTKHMMKVMAGLQDSCDYMESQLMSELENGRLFRLMTKLNFIIDRPEVDDWNENGNKYIIKLFRDYIFCQYDEFGKPMVDLSRVLTNLNKLDCGIDEKFLLVSRDEKNCILVSYKEVRDIIDSAFRSLTRN